MNKQNHQHGPDYNSVHRAYVPYWKRAHNDWRFWVGIVLMFLAIIIYVTSLDLSVRPRLLPQVPVSGAVEK